MESDPDFLDINKAKYDMDHIYNCKDPRLYFFTLKKLAYSIPDSASTVCRRLINNIRQRRRRDVVRIIDLGCSYGVNAALLKHGLSMDDLYRHWSQGRRAGESADAVIASDRKYFNSLAEAENLEITGIDQAENAVRFGKATNLLDQGLAVDFEASPLPPPLADTLAATDLLISTGCVGYVTEKSFDRLMPAISRKPAAWVANFVLRMFPYQPIEDCLAKWGYVTEKLENTTFVQRRFASADEQDRVLGQLSDRNIDPTGQEEAGNLVAELYLSRPKEEARQLPLPQILAGQAQIRQPEPVQAP